MDRVSKLLSRNARKILEKETMKRMILNKKQRAEMKRIVLFFMECTEPISNPSEKGQVAAKILSHLACFTDRLTGHLNKNQKWEEV